MTCAGLRGHLLLSAARSRLEGRGLVEGALLPPQHEVLRYRESLLADPGSPHAGMVTRWDQRQPYTLETGTRGKP